MRAKDTKGNVTHGAGEKLDALVVLFRVEESSRSSGGISCSCSLILPPLQEGLFVGQLAAVRWPCFSLSDLDRNAT